MNPYTELQNAITDILTHIHTLQTSMAAEYARLHHLALINLWGTGTVLCLMAVSVGLGFRIRYYQKRLAASHQRFADATVTALTAIDPVLYDQDQRLMVIEARLGIQVPPPAPPPEVIN